MDKTKIAALLMPKAHQQAFQTKVHRNLCGLFLCFAIIAMAGPSFHASSNPQAINRQALIILFDLSPSMLAQDSKPDRLTRAHLTLIDLLRLRNDGETALVVYAGDAHRVAPLSDDPATLENLVHTLHPAIMPVPGSSPEKAIALALSLFESRGLQRGDLLLITDGIADEAYATIKSMLPPTFRLSIFAVGSSEGAAIPDNKGSYWLTTEGQIIISAPAHLKLEKLAIQQGGIYATIAPASTVFSTTKSSNAGAVERMAKLPAVEIDLVETTDAMEGFYDLRHDAGYWLVLLMLPLAAYAFRRGLIWVVIPCLIIPFEARPADEDNIGFSLNNLSSLWLNQDQQALRELTTGNSLKAATMFNDLYWKAMAYYLGGNYSEAVRILSKLLSGSSDELQHLTDDDFYNLGNAFALNGQYDEAIEAYDYALSLYADNADANYNRAIVLEYVSKDVDQDDQGGSANTHHPNATNTSTLSRSNSDQTEQQIAANTGAYHQQSGSSFGGGESLDQQSLSGTAQQLAQTEIGDITTNLEDDISSLKTDLANLNSEPLNEDKRTSEIDPQAKLEASESIPVNVEQNTSTVLNPYSEQWLQSLPADPGGYLRRKFRYIAQQNIQNNPGITVPTHPERY